MKKKARICLILGLILVGLIVGEILLSIYPLQKIEESELSIEPRTGQPIPRQNKKSPPDVEAFYIGKTIFSFVNISLILPLLLIYIDIYRKIKSKFTIGLLIVMMVLFLYALTSNPLFHRLFGYRAEGLGPFAMIPDLFATFALAILLYMSLE